MVNVQNPNMELLLLAVNQLGDLVDEMVFIGGCATGLLITDAAAPQIRVTKDIDAIVQVATKADYYKLHEILENRQFVDAVYGHMPTDEVNQSRVERILNTIKNISKMMSR